MDNLAQMIQDALNSGRIIGAVILDGVVLTPGKRDTGKLGPITKPAVLAVSGDLTLYADFSVGSATMDAHSAKYKGPQYPVYGFFCPDTAAVFPQVLADPTGAGSIAYNQAALHGPFGQIADWQQGSAATLAADGHGYVHGSVHAIRGTLATKFKTSELATLAAAWAQQSPPYFALQVEQDGTNFYKDVAKH